MAAVSQEYRYAVIGGGIAGVTCAEQLSALCPDEPILLLTATPLIKAVVNFRQVSKTLEEFDVEEKPFGFINQKCENVKVIHDKVTGLNCQKKEISTEGGEILHYGKLCICSGASPKIISKENPYILGIRDTETVKVFQKKLADARRIVVVGNGGIATELVYEVTGCDVIWAIKDKSITSTFIDAGAAEFLLPELSKLQEAETTKPIKRHKYTTQDDVSSSCHGDGVMGGALGPDWASDVAMHGTRENTSHNVHIEYQVEVTKVMTPEELDMSAEVSKVMTPAGFDKNKEAAQSVEQNTRWPVYIKLTNGHIYGCDFIVSATGVTPNNAIFLSNNQFEVGTDGGLLVNDQMQTTKTDVYAAGDACTAAWQHAPHWLQMRLWSQARQTGAYAAKCMVGHSQGDPVTMDFCFELFAHVTKFFNNKVVLLGRYNAQGLEADHELLLRVTKGVEYIKVVLSGGRMQGAILIGETDLEETFENLILNQMDLSVYGEDLLDPNIDIEDYFD